MNRETYSLSIPIIAFLFFTLLPESASAQLGLPKKPSDIFGGGDPSGFVRSPLVRVIAETLKTDGIGCDPGYTYQEGDAWWLEKLMPYGHCEEDRPAIYDAGYRGDVEVSEDTESTAVIKPSMLGKCFPNGRRYCFLGKNAGFLTGAPDGKVTGAATTIGEWEDFSIEVVDGGRVALKNRCSGKYLTATDHGIVECNATKVQDWEKWKPIIVDNRFLSLESHHGKFLTISPEGKVKADAEKIDGWEHLCLWAYGKGRK